MRRPLNLKESIRRVAFLACRPLAAIALLVFGCCLAMGETARMVQLPITLRTEAGRVRTSACLQMEERVYPQTPWWEAANSNADAAERAFKSVLVAIKRKDRDELFRLSHPALGRDPKQFDQQAGALFQQFTLIELVSVPRAYELDGLVVFYGKIRSANGQESAFAPFVFGQEEDGSFGFLPYRTDKLTYQLLDDWFQEPWGPSKTDRPAYCSDEEIKHTTYAVALGSLGGASRSDWRSSRVLLNGAPLDTRGELAKTAGQLKTTIDEMKSALVGGRLDDFVKRMAPEDGKRLKEWFTSASQSDIGGYTAAITKQQPFFFFDASPLFVVYTKSSAGAVQVMYFTLGPRNTLLWTNSSYITIIDGVFKQGPLKSAASLERPFSSIAIK